MIRALLHVISTGFVLLAALPVLAQLAPKEEKPLFLPSGLEAELQEMLWDRPGGGLVFRFRFVAPGFTGEEVIEAVSLDLEFLCNTYALPRLANTGPNPSLVIISLADKPSEFGIYDAGVTQVFEAYRVENDTCIWEVF